MGDILAENIKRDIEAESLILDEIFASMPFETRGDCGEMHASFNERLDCNRCAHAIAFNYRPWMFAR